ncbi:uncharacterized protein LOC116952292 isoform X1 [Petromyzon marinus]|uniref:uncharacterized protein LOC116952292 isoform X1 n=1 Tax=Petromyzon marinus TaxID=7757 RepID=UPI003F7067A5
MKKIFGLGKRKKGLSPSASETGSVISRYELKDKDLGKLHKAAASGDLEKLKRLLKKGDVNQLDKQNRTPLHLACANGHSDVVLFLLQNNFVKLNLCDNDNRSPLMKAVQCQQEACVKALLEHKADPTLVDSNGLTALHQAALIPSCPIAQLLLRHNAHIDAENKDGNTPLLLAMSSGDLTMVELLLRHGANVDSRNRARRTPLMIAASNGENEIVKLLLEHGADVSCKDDKGWSAEDHAVIHGHHACSHLIGEQGVRAAQSQLSVGSTGRGPVLPELGAAARLGIPALNKAGEDASHTETLSRTGPTAEEAAGSWCSSDDEDVLDFSPKKPLKPDLSKLLSVSQRLESEGSSNPYPVPDQEFSGESGDERKVSARPLPRASPPSSYSRVPRPSSPSPRLDPFARPRHGHLKAADNEDDEEEEEWEEEDAAGSCSDESLHSGSPRALGPPGPGKHGTRSPHAARRDLMAALGLEEEDAEDGGEDAAEDADGEAAGTGEDEDKEDDEEEDDGQEHGRWSPSDSEFSEAVSDKKEARPLQKPPGQETSSKPLTVLSGNKPNVIDDLGLDDADDLEDASEWDSMGSRSEASHDAGPSPLKPPRAQTAELKGFHAGRDAGEPSQLARRSNHGDTRSNASRPVQEPSGSGSGGSGGDGVGSEAAPRGAAGTTRDARAAGSAGAVGGGHAPASPREPRPPADLEQAALASSSKPPSRFAGASGSAAGRRASLVLPPGKPTAESEPSQSVESCPLKIAKRESSDLSSLSAEKVAGAAAGSGPRTLPSVQTAALVNTSNNNNNSSSSSNLFSSAYIEHPSKIEDKSKVAFDEIGSPGVDPDEDLCETFSSGGTSQREELDVEAITDQRDVSKVDLAPVSKGVDDESDEPELEDNEQSVVHEVNDSRSLDSGGPEGATAADDGANRSRAAFDEQADGRTRDGREKPKTGSVENAADTGAAALPRGDERATDSSNPQLTKIIRIQTTEGISALPAEDQGDVRVCRASSAGGNGRRGGGGDDDAFVREGTVVSSTRNIGSCAAAVGQSAASPTTAQACDEDLASSEKLPSYPTPPERLHPTDRPPSLPEDSSSLNVKALVHTFNEMFTKSAHKDQPSSSIVLKSKPVDDEQGSTCVLASAAAANIDACDAAVNSELAVGVKSLNERRALDKPALEDCHPRANDALPSKERGTPCSSASRSVDSNIDCRKQFSEKECRDDIERFNHEVDVLKQAFFHLEKQNIHLKQKITSDRPGKAAGDAAVRRDFQNGPASLSAQTSGPKPSEIEQGPRHGLAVGRHARDVEQIPEEHQHRSGRRAIGSDGGVRSPPPRPLSDSLAPTKRHTAASKERTARIGVESNDIKTGLAAGLDELTESSDTEDSEGAVIGSLPSSSNPILQGLSIADPAQYARLQAWVFQAQRGLEWEKDRYCLLSDKLKQVETERSAVKKALSEMTRSKEGLEEEKVNLESDLDALRDSLQQERENGRGVATLYEKCQAQLQLKEEQLLLEEKDKRHAEHSLQSVQLEKSIAEQRMQLLEKKLSEIQLDLENERKLRLQQERILDEHLQKQQQSHEERENNSGEELGRPSLALDNSKLQEEISVLNRDMQRQSASFREREELLMNEKNTLLENLEALRRKVNLNEDALQQAVQKYNVELSNAKAAAEENARRLEQERVGRERALEELETVRKQLLRATSERGDGLEENGGPGQPERRQRRRDATELQELLEREGLLSQQLSRTESRCSELESERHRQSLELVEKDHALETCRRELGAARQRAEELDVALRGGREETAKLLVREESQKERMVQAQSDNLLLRQQLQEASAKVLQKEAVVTGIQDRFDDLLSKLQADKNQREQVLEERNQELVASAICLKETLKKLEDEKNNNEDLLHQRKQDLADALKKLAMSEASLDFTVNHRTALEAEKSQLHNNLESQRQQLLEKEREHVRVEQQLQQVQAALQQSRREAAAHAASDHEHACSLDRARRQLQELEDKCQRVEGERSQLEAAVQAHSGTAEALRAQLQRSAQDCKSLEETAKQLSEEKNALEEKLKQIESAMLAASAEKAPELPESDARLSQLSTEKAEVAAKLDEERRRLGEVEGRLEHKSRKYADLQEECNRMKLQIKALKKEREQARLSRSEGDRFLLQGDDPGRHAQEKRLEELTRQLQAAHDTAQSLQRSNRELEEQLRRSKRHLQKQQLSGSVATQAELERHKRELHELARTELASKLQEVNTFLQSQAVSQETLEGLRSMNELHLKRLMEQKLQELEAEVERLRSNAEDSQRATEHLQAELRRYTSLYQEELSCRKALSAKLESANERLADMSAHLGSERQRSSQLMSGRLLDNTALAALLPIATTGLRQPQGLLHQPQGLYHQPQGRPPGLSQSLLSYPADSQNSGTFKHAYHTKMQQEMDKIFSRELCQAHAELDGASQRFSPLGAAGDAWERDPVARATSQYVDVLVDRHRI